MNEEIKKFTNKLKNSETFQAKVAIGHILIAKVFLDIYFEKYYINFVNNNEFNENAFLKSIGYIDIMLNGENYTDRYTSFEDMQDVIVEILAENEKNPLTLRQSIISDLSNIIQAKDESGNLISAPYSLDFKKNKFVNQKVKKAIEDFLESEKIKLRNLLIKGVRSSFLRKVKAVLG